MGSRSGDGVGQVVWVETVGSQLATMGLKNLVELLDPALQQLVGLRNWWCLFLYSRP